MALSGCYAILKYIVVLLNLIFWLTGLAILTLAVWLLADATYYMKLVQHEENYIGLYVLLGSGLLLFFVGVMGCSGAFRESQCLLVTFFCFLLIILVAEVAAGVWAWSHSEQLEELIRKKVSDSVLKEYGEDSQSTESFDELQKTLGCCGANGPGDWAKSVFNTNNTKGEKGSAVVMTMRSQVTSYLIPVSCCSEDDPQQCMRAATVNYTATIPDIFYPDGCSNKLIELVKTNEPYILAVCLGVLVLEFMGLIFSIILCCAIRTIDAYKA